MGFAVNGLIILSFLWVLKAFLEVMDQLQLLKFEMHYVFCHLIAATVPHTTVAVDVSLISGLLKFDMQRDFCH